MARDVAIPDSETSKEVAIPVDDIDGLEDMSEADMTIPRITIDHKEGCFVDSQTNERFTEFDAVMLGLVKQRVLWPPTPGAEGEGPMCRAVDFTTGYPDAPKWVVKHDGVTAVGQSGFTFAEVEEGKLSCANCGLKEWDSNPKNSTPWCNEQFTFPILRVLEDGTMAPALISFQRTGLKPCKSYVSGFRQAKRPLYTAITRVTAVHQKKGQTEWVTPSFSRLSDSDPSEHPHYSKSLAEIREFITTPRTMEETEVEVKKVDVVEATATEAEATPAAAATPAPAAPDYDEEEPF
jgi:hypothetical protein